MGETRFFGFIARKQRWVLTGRGWACACLIVVAGVICTIGTVYPFLTVSDPVGGDILVVEGWLPDTALQQAVQEFERHDYRLLVSTGGPLRQGSFLIQYETCAQLAASTLKRLGIDAQRIVAVPASRVKKDRTYASALALKTWLEKSRMQIHSLDLLTLGPHARRSWLLFEEALPLEIKVGVIAVEDASYNPDQWWTSSEGVRTVIGEAIAYIYARFFFFPQQMTEDRGQMTEDGGQRTDDGGHL